ncbi:MAG TPA: dihydrolipoamide acetyltransferase family protein, partial [Novosphingobium sp.]|nr:dihydrolipoamide acetyltransferase family protein [Novosphingobium sp.]
MGRYTFRLPDIGEGIAEAEIVAWHVKLGDRVEEDGRLADMMTDKATVEMESPVAGTVVELAGAEGDTVAIGAPLVVIETGDDLETSDPPPPGEGNRREAVVEGEAPPEPSAEPPAPTVSPSGPATSPEGGGSGARVLASQAVRARARDLGIDLAQVRSAEDGRVRHADLDAYLAYSAGGGFAPAGRKRADEQVRVIGLRRRIAENMAASKRHIPHFSYVEECDVTDLEAARAQLNDARGDKPRLTLLPLLIAAICRALPDYPMINARYDDEAGIVTRFGAVHLGVAAQTPAGLMVPVIRHAESRNLWQLAA